MEGTEKVKTEKKNDKKTVLVWRNLSINAVNLTTWICLSVVTSAIYNDVRHCSGQNDVDSLDCASL